MNLSKICKGEKERTCDYGDWRGTETEGNEAFQLWLIKLLHRLVPKLCEADRAFSIWANRFCAQMAMRKKEGEKEENL